MNSTITVEEYAALKKAIEWMECIDFTAMIARLATGQKARGLMMDDNRDPEDIGFELYQDDRLFEFLGLISILKAKHDDYLELPDLSVPVNDLTPEEREDVERWRDINRVRDLLGGKKEIQEHRKILKAVFDSIKDQDLRKECHKTWAALDAQLENDIRFEESLARERN